MKISFCTPAIIVPDKEFLDPKVLIFFSYSMKKKNALGTHKNPLSVEAPW